MLLTKQREAQNSDVGSLVAEMEGYGDVWQEFERVDALRELIQKYKQLQALRPDGTPQLNDWELWHMTRNRPVQFTCRCGESYTLLGGFTVEEIEQALIQAQRVYGFGLEGIEGADHVDDGKVHEELVIGEFVIEEHLSSTDLESEDDEDTETPLVGGDGDSV